MDDLLFDQQSEWTLRMAKLLGTQRNSYKGTFDKLEKLQDDACSWEAPTASWFQCLELFSSA